MAIDSAPDLGKPIAPLQALGLQDEKQGIEAVTEEPVAEEAMMPLDGQGRNLLDAPVPGQSLTNDPNEPHPFERPPVFTTVNEASSALFRGMTSESGREQVIDLISRDLPLEDIAAVFTFELFRTGLINPDMMLLLAEPTLLILLFIAEYAGLEAIIAKKITEDLEDESEAIAKMMNELVVEDGELLDESDVQMDLQQVMITRGAE